MKRHKTGTADGKQRDTKNNFDYWMWKKTQHILVWNRYLHLFQIDILQEQKEKPDFPIQIMYLTSTFVPDWYYILRTQ